MDITGDTFEQNLQAMLEQLSTAHFVAFDLEFSGISTKTLQKITLGEQTNGTRKQSLQQRYEEIRDAAEKYTVLQVGFTIVKENEEIGTC